MSRRRTDRPMLYQPRGEEPFPIRGTLSRPAAEELIGGLEETQRIFLARAADLVAAGVTEPDKWDGVTEPGFNAVSGTVTTKTGNIITVDTIDPTLDPADVPIEVGWTYAARDYTNGVTYAGKVIQIHQANAYLVLNSSPGQINGHAIIFYQPDKARDYSIHNAATLYQGSSPKWFRAEVTG